MKGPGLRIDLDVRRVWRCPRCNRVVRTSGAVASQRCSCADEGVWMQLQPPVKREPFRPAPREAEPPEPDSEPGDTTTVDVAQEIHVEIEQLVAARLADEPHVEPLQSEAAPSPPILISAAPSEATDVRPAAPEQSPPDAVDEGFGAGITHDAAEETG